MAEPIETDSERVSRLARSVMDPELPVVTLGELGIVRDTWVVDGKATVVITPTYSGCPAMHEIHDDIVRALNKDGFVDVEIHTRYSPAWTTDWISASGRAKLLASGVAPPPETIKNPRQATLPLLPPQPPPACPQCRAVNVEEISRFGPTACTALWRCRECAEPFEHMKAH